MRIWQCFAVKEMARYGEQPSTIAGSVGLPVSIVQCIMDEYGLADTILLQYEKDVNRCPKCGHKVKTNCFTCYQSDNMDKCIDVIERPDTHKGYMLNACLYKEG